MTGDSNTVFTIIHFYSFFSLFSSANHSRNSSNGSTPPFMVDVIMNPEIVTEKLPETEEQERLLDDQRSKS